MLLTHDISENDLLFFAEISASCHDADQSLASISKFHANKQLIKLSWDQQTVGYIIEQVTPPEADLIQILIGPKYRKSGLASQVLRQWLTDLQNRSVSEVFLEVREGNTPAKYLYKRQGFHLVGTRKGYYEYKGSIEDALLLRLDL